MENKYHDFVAMTMFIRCSVTQRLLEQRALYGAESLPELTAEDWATLERFDRPDLEDGHAGISEAAYIMGIAPDSVKLDRLGRESGLSRNLTQKYRDVGIQIRDSGWGINYPNSYAAHDPVGCSERIGHAALKLEAERVAKAVKLGFSNAYACEGIDKNGRKIWRARIPVASTAEAKQISAQLTQRKINNFITQ